MGFVLFCFLVRKDFPSTWKMYCKVPQLEFQVSSPWSHSKKRYSFLALFPIVSSPPHSSSFYHHQWGGGERTKTIISFNQKHALFGFWLAQLDGKTDNKISFSLTSFLKGMTLVRFTLERDWFHLFCLSCARDCWDAPGTWIHTTWHSWGWPGCVLWPATFCALCQPL